MATTNPIGGVFWRMVAAELRKLLSRASGVVMLVISVLLPILVFALAKAVESGGASVSANGQPVTSLLSLEGPKLLGYMLTARNFFVLPLFLVMVSAQLVAEERANFTLRALLALPNARWRVLLAKYTALLTLAALSIAGSLGVGGPLCFVFVTGPAELAAWQGVALGWVASLASDAGLIALTLLISTFSSSVAGVLVGVILGLMADLAIRGLLQIAGMLKLFPTDQLAALMPGRALAAWEGYADGWDPWAFLGLGLLTLGCLAVATFRFQREDVL
ncbi:MAG: family transporter protein [Pseudomonadota bacterium]|jgi:ABC-type transport system involved in multi-copper enzyme maturation permease subunit